VFQESLNQVAAAVDLYFRAVLFFEFLDFTHNIFFSTVLLAYSGSFNVVETTSFFALSRPAAAGLSFPIFRPVCCQDSIGFPSE
jgi:hypothetical protein